MSIQEFTNKLSKWVQESHKKIITDILHAINKLDSSQGEQNLKQLLEVLGKFHKQACKAKKEEIEQEWFKLTIDGKKHINKLLQHLSHPQVLNNKPIEDINQIKLPEELVKDKDITYKLVMQALYNHFFLNMKSCFTSQNQKVIDYLDKVITCLYKQFGFSKEQKNKDAKQTSKFFDRIQGLYTKLAHKSSTILKQEIIEGFIDPKMVATINPIIFFEEEAKRIRKERLAKKLKQ